MLCLLSRRATMGYINPPLVRPQITSSKHHPHYDKTRSPISRLNTTGDFLKLKCLIDGLRLEIKLTTEPH